MAFATALTRKNRLVSMLSDPAILIVVTMFFGGPVIFFRGIWAVAAHRAAGPDIFIHPWYAVLVFSLYFNKDLYLGQSPAKRIMRFRVVDVRTGRPAGPLRCLVRNVTLLIWPVEVVAAMVNVERRLGDFIAGTKLSGIRRSRRSGWIGDRSCWRSCWGRW